SEGTAGRRIPIMHGRTLGGSSSINGFNYTRGLPIDYDTWAGQGNAGWSYAEVLPYFKRTERRVGPFDPRYRGGEGLLPITDSDWSHPLCDAFIDGAVAMGIPRNPDYNGEKQAGVGYYQRWIHHGRRVSSARAFLRPAMKRSNLKVLTNAHAVSVMFEGKRAIGVCYSRGPGCPVQSVRARKEVILCAGAANTPKLLQLSGVGPRALLDQLGVPVVHDLPGVGENCQDHYMVRSSVRVKGVKTLNSTARGFRLLGEIAKWLLGKPSLLAISPSVAYGFWQSRETLPVTDLQFCFSPGSFASGLAGKLNFFPGMTLGFYQLRPHSTGFVRAQSTDPFQDPIIQPNYLSDERDRQVVIDGVRLTRRLLHTPQLQVYCDQDVAPPASAISDSDLLDFARNNGGTAWHLIGTCRMGLPTAADSVVDSELRVIGMQGLRVVDASIMPTMPSGNTGAATMMIAEKAADMILGHPPLPSEPLNAMRSAAVERSTSEFATFVA
ncbi:MAG: GMC family oxidoreductase N-terminal domain-containing protein, partial [Acetobacteraceae bacterium]|nr:GMC family oxidoreductase N-terminal domain-containing protein [Acetobacteraceae bacterium]